MRENEWMRTHVTKIEDGEGGQNPRGRQPNKPRRELLTEFLCHQCEPGSGAKVDPQY